MAVLVVGSSNSDVFCYVDRLPESGETIIGNEMAYKLGGKGANQVVSLARLGSETTFLTSVGSDEKGLEIINSLKNDGVNTDFIKKSDNQPTGTAVINVDKNGKNTIVVIKGANDDCDTKYLLENENLFTEHTYLLLQLEIPIETVKKSIELAKNYNVKVVLNPAPASVLEDDIYRNIDILTPNETELELLAFGDIKERSLDECAKILLDKGVKNIIVTVGEKGAVLYEKDKKVEIETLKVKAVDTVAAGDCFNGALVSSLDKGENLIDAIKFANKAAAISVTRYGAQESIPTLYEVMNYKMEEK